MSEPKPAKEYVDVVRLEDGRQYLVKTLDGKPYFFTLFPPMCTVAVGFQLDSIPPMVRDDVDQAARDAADVVFKKGEFPER